MWKVFYVIKLHTGSRAINPYVIILSLYVREIMGNRTKDGMSCSVGKRGRRGEDVAKIVLLPGWHLNVDKKKAQGALLPLPG